MESELQKTFSEGQKIRVVRVNINIKPGTPCTKKGKVGILALDIKENGRIYFKNHPAAKGYPVTGEVILVPIQDEKLFAISDNSTYIIERVA